MSFCKIHAATVPHSQIRPERECPGPVASRLPGLMLRVVWGMHRIHEIGCLEAVRLQEREEKNRRRARETANNPWVAAAYTHAGNELRAVRHQHECDCIVCTEREARELAQKASAA